MCHQATKFLYNSVWQFLCCLAGRQKNEQINRWLCKQSFTTTFGLAKEPKKGAFLGTSVWSLQYFGRWNRLLSHRRDLCCTKHTETHYMTITRDLCKVYPFVCPSIHKAVSAEMAQHFCLSSCSASPQQQHHLSARLQSFLRYSTQLKSVDFYFSN